MARPKKSASKSGRPKPGRHRSTAEASGRPGNSYGRWLLRRLGDVTGPAVPLLAVGALVAGASTAAATGVQDALADRESLTEQLAPSGRVDLSLREEQAAGRSADRSEVAADKADEASAAELAAAAQAGSEAETVLASDPFGAAAEPGSTAGEYSLGEQVILGTLEGQAAVRARTARVTEQVEVAIRKAKAAAEARRRAAAREAAERRREAALARAWHLPLESYSVSATFGEAGSYWSSGYHTGLDFSASSGTPVHSVGPGEVVEATWDDSYGNQIKIRHADGTETWYCHLTSFERTSGSVGGGEVIGYVGSTGNSTGPHLHMEVRPYGDSGDPIDPAAWLSDRGVDVY